MGRVYLCIDLKSFYASVECVERNLDPMTTHLVVADASRTEKTICLAVTPALKAYGLSGRSRLFEVIQKAEAVNRQRKSLAPGGELVGESYDAEELSKNPALKMNYIIAPPRMRYYSAYSTRIYEIYLKYVAPEDIHVYSVDEVFIDITDYLKNAGMTPHEMAKKIIREILQKTGITATAGIGTNLYLAKIAMDIVAKKIPADEDGVRIAELDEMSYREQLWNHRPLTDFWRVAAGYSKKLEKIRLYTMGDIARYSLTEYGEDKLYQLFGINAELLIDHAWGWEPCTIADVKAYEPQKRSLSSGQVLHCAYEYEKTKLIIKEMAEALSFDLVEKALVTDKLVLTVGYDVENLTNPGIYYEGEITTNHYGKKVPKSAHGTVNLGRFTSSARLMTDAVMSLFEQIVNPSLLARRINLTADNVISEQKQREKSRYEQIDLFDTCSEEKKAEEAAIQKERKIQKAVLAMKKKYGKNAIFKGKDLQEGATTRERNDQIGGHKA